MVVLNGVVSTQDAKLMKGKRVLLPPGGGNSDIFGTQGSSSGSTTPSDGCTPRGSRRGSKTEDTQNRLFGSAQETTRKIKDHFKSTIFSEPEVKPVRSAPRKGEIRRNPITGEVYDEPNKQNNNVNQTPKSTNESFNKIKGTSRTANSDSYGATNVTPEAIIKATNSIPNGGCNVVTSEPQIVATTANITGVGDTILKAKLANESNDLVSKSNVNGSTDVYINNKDVNDSINIPTSNCNTSTNVTEQNSTSNYINGSGNNSENLSSNVSSNTLNSIAAKNNNVATDESTLSNSISNLSISSDLTSKSTEGSLNGSANGTSVNQTNENFEIGTNQVEKSEKIEKIVKTPTIAPVTPIVRVRQPPGGRSSGIF